MTKTNRAHYEIRFANGQTVADYTAKTLNEVISKLVQMIDFETNIIKEIVYVEPAEVKVERETYKISKLARAIADILDEVKIVVWDVLEELDYKEQELSKVEVNQWASKVEDLLAKERNTLHVSY